MWTVIWIPNTAVPTPAMARAGADAPVSSRITATETQATAVQSCAQARAGLMLARWFEVRSMEVTGSSTLSSITRWTGGEAANFRDHDREVSGQPASIDLELPFVVCAHRRVSRRRTRPPALDPATARFDGAHPGCPAFVPASAPAASSPSCSVSKRADSDLLRLMLKGWASW